MNNYQVQVESDQFFKYLLFFVVIEYFNFQILESVHKYLLGSNLGEQKCNVFIISTSHLRKRNMLFDFLKMCFFIWLPCKILIHWL